MSQVRCQLKSIPDSSLLDSLDDEFGLDPPGLEPLLLLLVLTTSSNGVDWSGACGDMATGVNCENDSCEAIL